MRRFRSRGLPGLIATAVMVAAATPAFAHHLMGGKMPTTSVEGLLSGLGHPVIGLDHFAAVIAIGCLAATHRAGTALVVGAIGAMMIGAALHVRGTTVPGAEILVALTVIGLGAALLPGRRIGAGAALAMFSVAGLIHGYALGESIAGAEPSPLVAYFVGLGVIQAAIALVAMAVARMLMRRDALMLRFAGAGIAGIGIAILVQQVAAAA